MGGNLLLTAILITASIHSIDNNPGISLPLTSHLTDDLGFIFYNTSHYLIINASTPEYLLEQPNFDKSKKTVFFISDEHLGSKKINNVIDAYVRINKQNVLNLFYNYRHVTNFDQLLLIGQTFAKSLSKLISEGLTTDKIVLVGHSLGGHIISIIANYTTPKLPLSIGLDPSIDVGVFDKGYTKFTIALWTNSGEFGQSEWNADANFIANNGTRQPHCKNLGLYCHHLMALKYWAYMILKPNLFQGIDCNATECNRYKIIELGSHVRKKGTYFFQTSDKQPYGLGFAGTQHIQPPDVGNYTLRMGSRGGRQGVLWIKPPSSSSDGSAFLKWRRGRPSREDDGHKPDDRLSNSYHGSNNFFESKEWRNEELPKRGVLLKSGKSLKNGGSVQKVNFIHFMLIFCISLIKVVSTL